MAEISSYIEREVAILIIVRQGITLPVAGITSFDSTNKPPLDSGFVIQSQLAGVPSCTLWDDLTHEQRCSVAKEVDKPAEPSLPCKK